MHRQHEQQSRQQQNIDHATEQIDAQGDESAAA
jgi:hypothetical protein